MQTSRRIQDPAKWIETMIKDFINKSPENTLKNEKNDKAWADPLVGFSRGDDPLYQEYKEHIGPFHWTPLEVFGKTFPLVEVTADQLTVISWILPQTKSTKTDLRRETVNPSESWARARIFGEEVNVKLRKYVVAALKEAGIEAVAPMLSPLWGWKESERYVFASTWSERHAAYTAGLGTFGLCDGLITPRGKAMRCGSVVAQIKVPATNRPYNDHHAYCLFFSQGTCGKCIQRCPADAVTEAGHDKKKCKSYVEKTASYVKSQFHFDGYGCGFCQTGVPCESQIPAVDDSETIL
jgi:epoxyqueuosine reductase QueG